VAALTDAACPVIQFSVRSAAVAPVTPLRVALLTTLGDDTVAGVEVTGGGYTRQTFLPTVAATDGSGQTTVKNSTLIRFNNMPAVTVVGFAIYDSATTPFRWVYAALSAPRSFSLGDPAEFAVGDLVITGD
jgi:hypothetical protein